MSKHIKYIDGKGAFLVDSEGQEVVRFPNDKMTAQEAYWIAQEAYDHNRIPSYAFVGYTAFLQENHGFEPNAADREFQDRLQGQLLGPDNQNKLISKIIDEEFREQRETLKRLHRSLDQMRPAA